MANDELATRGRGIRSRDIDLVCLGYRWPYTENVMFEAIASTNKKRK